MLWSPVTVNKKQINLRLDTDLLNRIDNIVKKSDLDRTQWINKALNAVTLALNNEDSLENEYQENLQGTTLVPSSCSRNPHIGIYENCQSQFESLG